MSSSNGISQPERPCIKEIVDLVQPQLSDVQQLIMGQLLKSSTGTCDLVEFVSRQTSSSTKEKFNPSKGSILKELSDARARLKQFYKAPEGFGQPLRLEIPSGTKPKLHSLEVTDNIPEQNATGFWAAHLGSGKATKIITGRPMFLQGQDSGVLVRGEVFEGEKTFMRELLNKAYPDLLKVAVHEVKPYVAVANVPAIVSVFSYFDSWRKDHGHPQPEILTREEDAANEDANLVVLGTPFDCGLVRDLEEAALEAFVETNWAGLGSLYIPRSLLGISKVMPNGDFRVWVHRRFSGSRYETLVNASASELLAPICDILTTDTKMKPIIEDLWNGKRWKGFPSTFRIQFRVRLSSGGSRVKKIWVQQYREGEEPIPNNGYCIQQGQLPPRKLTS